MDNSIETLKKILFEKHNSYQFENVQISQNKLCNQCIEKFIFVCKQYTVNALNLFNLHSS